jgi:hypothetical protein
LAALREERISEVEEIGAKMSGRRLHPRYVIVNCAGTLRVISEITVQQQGESTIVALCDEPLVTGDVVEIERMHGAAATLLVRVVETRPVVHDGSVRYSLRLAPFDMNEPSDAESRQA